ncbi:Uncharacterised protein [Amycolatopsis camponoti]|uniref:Uncharacterized protein n=1 Tax=Amycolatopsis camponoti TaxID=2606593 RepID=A0A6I8LQ24_9PSEU|nr:Uncharacterised protein [Amycolatopsis camponoti]
MQIGGNGVHGPHASAGHRQKPGGRARRQPRAPAPPVARRSPRRSGQETRGITLDTA